MSDAPPARPGNGRAASPVALGAMVGGAGIILGIAWNVLDLVREDASSDIAEAKALIVTHDAIQWHRGAGEAIPGLTKDVGALDERLKHHDASLELHGDRFTESDWTRERKHYDFRLNEHAKKLENFDLRLRALEQRRQRLPR